jgi:hypothetical protein
MTRARDLFLEVSKLGADNLGAHQEIVLLSQSHEIGEDARA